MKLYLQAFIAAVVVVMVCSCATVSQDRTLRDIAGENGRYRVIEIRHDEIKQESMVTLGRKDAAGQEVRFFRWYAFDGKQWRLKPVVGVRRPDVPSRSD